MVPVCEKNAKVRVCIDFRDLNKATQLANSTLLGDLFQTYQLRFCRSLHC